MDQNNTKVDRQLFSFKFTKKVEQIKFGENKLSDEPKETKSQDYVLSLEGKKIKSTVPEDEKKELVIPLILTNEWRLPTDKHKAANKLENKESLKKTQIDEDSLEALALKELLDDTDKEKLLWDERDKKTDSHSIPLIMQNRVPEGYETDEKMDVSLRPSESTLENYEQVPVEEYGYAVLKGMGWKSGDPIGNTNKKYVAPVEVILRPKGLGLGADKSILEKAYNKKTSKENLDLVKGAYICIKRGPHKGFYGQVEGLDEDNARVVVRLAINGTIITLSELFVRTVSKKEYHKESKVINNDSYKSYKNDTKDRGDKHKHRDRSGDHSDKHRSSRRESEDTYKSKLKEEYSSSKKRKHSENRKHTHSEATSWVMSQLRVRLIDEQYKKGKYYNQKMIIEDILSPDCIVCQTADKNILEDIHPSMVETVVPRSEPSYVMVVQGKYRGMVGTILKRDKSNFVATIQMLPDMDKIVKLDYNSVCEYVGDVSQFE